MKIVSVVGARPNFMKIAPFIRAVNAHNQKESCTKIDHLLVHTGQHYDDKMSRAFFKALDIPDADINLNIGSGTHAEQVGRTMMEFEKVVQKEKPDWVVVVGDVNATCACSITAKKEHVKCAHIEAGLRSRDLTMPEEINRLVTDRLSDLLLTPDRLSGENLIREGVSKKQIKFVGNIMIDTLEAQRAKAEKLDPVDIVNDNRKNGQARLSDTWKKSLINNEFAVMTLHRPSNVDDKTIMTDIMDFLINRVSADMPLIWPAHPRAVKQMRDFGLWDRVLETENFCILHPLNYHDLLRLNMGARLMLTDSGGLQEECCVLGTPCLTLRWNTERPVTLRENGGASILVGNDIEKIKTAYTRIMEMGKIPIRPELWDGKTAPRCVEAIIHFDKTG